MPTLGVIGAAGTVGRTAVRQLLEADASLRVTALVRKPVDGLSQLDRCEVHAGGIFDSGALDRLMESSDAVVNLAARNPAGEANDLAAREDFFLLNGLGAGLVAAAARRHGRPLVHFSTVAVYEVGAYAEARVLTEDERLPSGKAEVVEYYEGALSLLATLLAADSTPVGEDVLVNALGRYMSALSYPESAPVYGLSKLLGEAITLQIAENVCCIRMSDVYGPGHESRGVVVDHLTQLRDSNSVCVDFDFRANAHFAYIDDVTRLIRSAAEGFASGGAVPPRIVNFCGPRVDEAEFLACLEALCGNIGLQRNITSAQPASAKFDRRYSSAVFDRHFPLVEKTGFRRGLRATWDALAAASA